MESILKFLETLLNNMDNSDWSIEKIVEGDVVVEDGVNYLKVDGSLYEEQDDWYIEQWVGNCGDYYGVIFYPIEGNKYLKINYTC